MEDPAGGGEVIMDALNSDEMGNSNFGSMKNDSGHIDDEVNINL